MTDKEALEIGLRNMLDRFQRMPWIRKTSKAKKIVDGLILGKRQVEISKDLGISRQAVSEMIKRIFKTGPKPE